MEARDEELMDTASIALYKPGIKILRNLARDFNGIAASIRSDKYAHNKPVSKKGTG